MTNFYEDAYQTLVHNWKASSATLCREVVCRNFSDRPVFIIGFSSATTYFNPETEEEEKQFARDLGKALANHNRRQATRYVLVWGGNSPAAHLVAQQMSWEDSFQLLPANDPVQFKDRQAIHLRDTELERQVTLGKTAEVVVAVGGGPGTMVEMIAADHCIPMRFAGGAAEEMAKKLNVHDSTGSKVMNVMTQIRLLVEQ